MLSKEKITKFIEESNLLQNDLDGSRKLKSQIQSSSIDLTIDKIHSGDEDISKANAHIRDSAHDVLDLEPGQTVVIQVAELFNMPAEVGGVIFPPNSMSKSGIIMTNPGHIDPNFIGRISVYLVNMGKKTVRLKRGEKVATLLLFDISGRPEFISDLIGHGVDKDQVMSLSSDFANIEGRLPKLISKYMKSRVLRWGGLCIGILGLLLVVFPIVTKYYFDNHFVSSEIKLVENKIESNKKLIESLISKIDENSLVIDNLKKELSEKKSSIIDLERKIKNYKKEGLNSSNLEGLALKSSSNELQN